MEWYRQTHTHVRRHSGRIHLSYLINEMVDQQSTYRVKKKQPCFYNKPNWQTEPLSSYKWMRKNGENSVCSLYRTSRLLSPSFPNFPHLIHSYLMFLLLLFASLLSSHWDYVPYMSKPVLTGVWCQLICSCVDRWMAAQHSICVCVCLCMRFHVCTCMSIQVWIQERAE